MEYEELVSIEHRRALARFWTAQLSGIHAWLCRTPLRSDPIGEVDKLLMAYGGRHARSPLRPRKQNSWPLRGSRLNISCTCSDRLAEPFLMSVRPVDSQTRTPVGSGIRQRFQARAGSAAGRPPRRRDRPGCAGRSCSRSRSAHSPIRYPFQVAPERSSPAPTQGARQAARAIRLAPRKQKADLKSRADAPSPTRAVGPTDSPRQCEPLPHLIQPSTASTRVNNLKTTDGPSVSKAIHTDSQLHLVQFGKAAHAG
jgi:hypothetical protein